MVANSFGNRNFTQPTRRLRGAYVFLSGFVWEGGGGGGGGGWGVFPIPNVFSLCSHQVPKVLH
jgi:hypothetical protein